jgi:hypothetical protein
VSYGLNGVAIALVLLSLPALFGYVGLFISAGLICVAQLPIALGVGMGALRLVDARLPTRWAGSSLAALAALYVLGLVGGVVAGAVIDGQLEGGVLVGMATVACVGPVALLGCAVIVRHAQLGVVTRPARLGGLAGGMAAVAGLLSLGLLLGGPTEEAVPWVLLLSPALISSAMAAALWRRARPHALEEVLGMALPQGMELDQSVLPVRVRYTAAIVDGLDATVARGGRWTPLGNPVLDHALPMLCADPAAMAARVHGHESAVLEVLHAWPLARLEPGAVVWEAEPAQLADALQRAGGDLHRLLRDRVRDTQRLARVLGRGGEE